MKNPFEFSQDGLGQWQWVKSGDQPGNSYTGFATREKAVKNAKRYGYIPDEEKQTSGKPTESVKPASAAKPASKSKTKVAEPAKAAETKQAEQSKTETK